jgi:hypothetical protein
LQLCCGSDEKDKLKRESFECRIVQRKEKTEGSDLLLRSQLRRRRPNLSYNLLSSFKSQISTPTRERERERERENQSGNRVMRVKFYDNGFSEDDYIMIAWNLLCSSVTRANALLPSESLSLVSYKIVTGLQNTHHTHTHMDMQYTLSHTHTLKE